MSVRPASAEPIKAVKEALASTDGSFLSFFPESIQNPRVAFERLADNESGLLEFEALASSAFRAVFERLAELDGGLIEFDPIYKAHALSRENLAITDAGLLNFELAIVFPTLTAVSTVFVPTFNPQTLGFPFVAGGSQVVFTPSLVLVAAPIAPTVVNRNPACGAFAVPPNANIEFLLVAGTNAIDIPSIIVEVNGVQAFVSSAFQAPFNGAFSIMTPIGSDLFFRLDHTTTFALGATVSVRVYAEDVGVLSVDSTCAFTIFTLSELAEASVGSRDLYKFLGLEIRKRDLEGSPRPGSTFLQRYISGMNSVWARLTEIITGILDLNNAEELDAKFLPFLKHIVGWTDEVLLKKITDPLSSDELRRLVTVSGRLWNTRGTEDAIISILRFVTAGARARIWNWFDFRWILGETELGEEHEGRDPWVVYLPSNLDASTTIGLGATAASVDGIAITISIGAFPTITPRDRFFIRSGPLNGFNARIVTGTLTSLLLEGAGVGSAFGSADWEIKNESFVPDDEFRSNLRIVDDGTLNRDQVLRILRLMRPTNERFDILYLLFLDVFDVNDDALQWSLIQPANTTLPVVADGRLTFPTTSGSEVYAIVPGSDAWLDLCATTRMRVMTGGASFRVRRSASNVFYGVDVFAGGFVQLRYRNGGPPVLLATSAFSTLPGVWYLVKVTLAPEAGQTRIQVHIDGSLLISVLDGNVPLPGTISIFQDGSSEVQVDEVEAWKIPAETASLTINEEP